ncbi:hypothetical protein [Mycolicibacterium llatzerense]|uniref:hypothetical protein n=1 Tax=Mycolicibacterium llatzerense TaxID=280871 RepID=UPI0013A6EF35|nr:hypothetical protein [Mycolicibacterium llatzerense]
MPNPASKLRALIKAMADTVPDARLQLYYREAQREKRDAQGSSPAQQPEPPAPSNIPRLDLLHYVDSDRLYDLLAGRGSVVPVPNLDWEHRRGPEHAEFRRKLVHELDRIALRAKRFTVDLPLRQLAEGDLLIFDTQVRTRNGVSPGQRFDLTGDLNHDPHIYIQRRGVRILMPLKPEMITTGTAFSYFGEGTVELAGVCRIKHRLARGDRDLAPATNKLQYLATPLVLGTVDFFHREEDLRTSPVIQALDVEHDELRTLGPWDPWEYVTDDDAGVDEPPPDSAAQ